MKKALALLIFLLLGVLLVSCGGSGKPSGTTAGGTTAPVTTPPTTTAPPPAPSIQGDSAIVFGSSDSFTVVYGESDSVGKDAARDLTDAIKGLGINLPAAVSDTSKSESMCELLVGETSRAISAQAKMALSRIRKA